QKKLIEPDSELTHAGNFLYMLRGEKPNDVETRIMNADFVLSAEHELNASTFSTRVTVSTISDLHSAIISGLGTLKGPIHGGARLAVMNMISEIGTADKTEGYILHLIKNKQKIMGFGHRVYRTMDPRAKIFKKMAKELAEENGDMNWYQIGEIMEEVVTREIVEKKGKPIYPNVDFYAGIIYKYLNFPPKLATAIFAIGRISGWLAHCLEQYADNRLIRPRAKYIGEHNKRV
ncbi:MAG: citrate/2-methylcitrate synthase, partial [Candidatus Heimdallarchaeaceae archaeon]